MKRISAIIMILLMLMPFASSYFYLKIKKHHIKRSVKHMLMEKADKNQLVKLSFSFEEINTKLKWEHSKEFEFEGKMYDIVETISEDGKITYYCWLDKEETELNKRLEQIVFQRFNNDEESNTIVHNLKRFSISLFSPPDFEKIKPKFIEAELQYPKIISFYKTLSLDMDSPPPDSFY